MNLHLGRRIKEISEYKNLKVKDLADLTGKTTQSIYDIFRKEDLGTDVLKQFASALKIPIVEFFQDETNNITYVGQGIAVSHGNNVKQTFNSTFECEKELEKALAIIEQMELRIKDKDETIALLKERK